MKEQKLKVVITGGGTAGHITPAISIAQSLEKNNQATIYYLGNENFIEKDLSLNVGYPFYHIDSKGMEGKNPFVKWKNFIMKNAKGILQANVHLKNIKPDFIISTGGFVTAPVLVAARILKIPYFIHEQNTVLGRVNKLFLMDAAEVYYSFDETIGGKNKRAGKTVGNPVPVNNAITPGENIVILGGSGGSEFLNDWALSFAQANPHIPIHLQAGKSNFTKIENKAKEIGLSNLYVYSFVDIMDMYEKAKFVVTRGGTSSLFELANGEIPAIIVPLPNAMDNHQYMNGKHFEHLGGMKVIEQIDQTENKTLDLLALEWWNDGKELNDKRKILSSFPYKNTSEAISNDIISIIKKSIN